MSHFNDVIGAVLPSVAPLPGLPPMIVVIVGSPLAAIAIKGRATITARNLKDFTLQRDIIPP
jgi:hypothetical protein